MLNEDKELNEGLIISENTIFTEDLASIFYVLKESEFGKILSDEQLLFACAILHLSKFLKKGLITFSEIKNAIILGQKNVCKLGNFEQLHRNFQDEDSIATDLIGFSMQLECLKYYIETKIPTNEIVNSIVAKKEKIIIQILKTLQRGENNNLEQTIIDNVNTMLNDTYFKNLVINYNMI